MMTVTVSPKFQVLIPQAMRDAMGIRPGQRIRALQHADRIELIPLRPMRKARRALKGVDTSAGAATTARSAREGSYVPRTALGRRLLELRNRSIRSGMKLLTVSEINEELVCRRGKSHNEAHVRR